MGADSHALSCLGFKITLDELKKAYTTYIGKHPDKAEDPEKYDERYNESAFEESMYYNFMEVLLEKYDLEYARLNSYGQDPIELCVCVWKKKTKTAWGHIQGTNVKKCNFTEIQECITNNTKNLKAFMTECGLGDESHELQMFIIHTGSY